jgi:hypothetical protein
MVETDLKAVVKNLSEWLKSPEGIVAMKRAAEKAAKDRAKIERLRKIPWELLHKPMDF